MAPNLLQTVIQNWSLLSAVSLSQGMCILVELEKDESLQP